MTDQAGTPEEKRELIVKKVMLPGGAPHGGAWKVAYADFVTAMMAFFLLLWLLNATTDEQKQGISNFFEPIGELRGSSGSGGVFGGISASDPGPTPEPSRNPELTVTPEKTLGDKDVNKDIEVEALKEDLPNVTEETIKNETRQFMAAEAAVQQALTEVPELRDLHESIKIDVTDEGLRIQLIDQKGVPMFKPGGAELNDVTRKLLLLIASVIERLPNKVTLSGHTDSTPLHTPDGRTNWDLSLDRANAGRRALQEFGVPRDRFLKVVGMADRELLKPDDPTSPSNRRLVIMLLRATDLPGGNAPQPPRIFGVD